MNDAAPVSDATAESLEPVNAFSDNVAAINVPWLQKTSVEATTRSHFAHLSVALAALVLFVAVNGYVQFSLAPYANNRFVFQNRDACWWAANNFNSLKQKPDILLVGSSLMCRVVNEGDATFLNHALNAGEHYRSEHLEQVLSSPQRKYRTTSLAVGGMNASDVGSLVPALITNDKKPYAIIYGIGPRDLFDNSLMSPSDGAGFRLAEKLTDMGSDVIAVARHSREAQFKHTLNGYLRGLLPLYRFQEELAIIFRRMSEMYVDSLLPQVFDTDTRYAFSQIQMTALNLLPLDTPNNCPVLPDDPLHPSHFDFRNNYYMSYNPFKPALYRRQIFFLERFLKYCQDQRIKTVVLKMPLRADNYGLMPPLLYQVYSKDIDRLAREYGALVVDAAAAKCFTEKDFTDTVHMSGLGSCKLVEFIGPTIKKFLEQK